MRVNGFLRYEVLTEGGVNEYGEVEEPTSEWSEPIPCYIKANSDNRKGKYEDGEFRQVSYTILIEVQAFNASRIQLARKGEAEKEYRVINSEPLVTVGRVQIMV